VLVCACRLTSDFYRREYNRRCTRRSPVRSTRTPPTPPTHDHAANSVTGIAHENLLFLEGTSSIDGPNIHQPIAPDTMIDIVQIHRWIAMRSNELHLLGKGQVFGFPGPR